MRAWRGMPPDQQTGVCGQERASCGSAETCMIRRPRSPETGDSFQILLTRPAANDEDEDREHYFLRLAP